MARLVSFVPWTAFSCTVRGPYVKGPTDALFAFGTVNAKKPVWVSAAPSVEAALLKSSIRIGVAWTRWLITTATDKEANAITYRFISNSSLLRRRNTSRSAVPAYSRHSTD
jgi:hypothetical protein